MSNCDYTYTHTGVGMTTEEEQTVRSASIDPLAGRFGPGRAFGGKSQSQLVHEFALAHGLPEHDGFYGYDFGKHEFIR